MNWILLLGMGIGIVVYWLVEKLYNLLKCEHDWVEIPKTKDVKFDLDGSTTTKVLVYCAKCHKTKKLIRKDTNGL